MPSSARSLPSEAPTIAPSSSRRKALFLDRDGTLILDKHYLSDPAGVELIPGVPAALRDARDRGYLLFLFTNQSGIGRGLYTLADTVRCNDRMLDLIGLGPSLFADICIAPEAPEQPQQYRKPSPRFILESIARHQLDPSECWMVGDNMADVEAGQNAGVNIAAVCTGKHTAEQWAAKRIAGLVVFPTLREFAAALPAS
jgi:D-glycero-D-manno-heptose 1,7-bisphosphate phosphatase